MSLIHIETLTSVHIGSGEMLQYGTDYIETRIDNENYISVIDPSKVMSAIGEANIYKWTAAIERHESTKAIVKQFAPNVKDEDYSKRLIEAWSKPHSSDTLKEQIHDGRGIPYIPGSSIKGAIRTAVLASITENATDLEDKIDKHRTDRKGQPLADAKKVEASLFGSNPNEDIFRFLHVGDAFFGDYYNCAIRMVNINERERGDFWDTSKGQLIEVIGPEVESSFELRIKKINYELAKRMVTTMPECLQSIPSLFKTINTHTIALLESEIEYWKERENSDSSDKVNLYIKRIASILKAAKQCSEGKQCVLRIGHGSGWRFITGAWTECLNNFYDLVVPASRPNNDKLYKKYDFPKTRRVNEDCELLGFVKMSTE